MKLGTWCFYNKPIDDKFYVEKVYGEDRYTIAKAGVTVENGYHRILTLKETYNLIKSVDANTRDDVIMDCLDRLADGNVLMLNIKPTLDTKTLNSFAVKNALAWYKTVNKEDVCKDQDAAFRMFSNFKKKLDY